MEEEDNCTICGDDFNNNKFTLKCKHYFHYNCLIDSLKVKLINNKIRPSSRCCPYCRQRIPLIPYKTSMGNHIPGIHNVLKISGAGAGPGPVPGPNTCHGICKNGQACKFKGKYNGYCGHHKIDPGHIIQ